jgi:mono/diheme cytochrome c family protein
LLIYGVHKERMTILIGSHPSSHLTLLHSTLTWRLMMKRRLTTPAKALTTALLASLGVVWGCREQVDPAELPAGEKRGEVLYAQRCAACHGIDGRGQELPAQGDLGVASRDLTSAEFQRGHTDEQILDALEHGVDPNMPGFEGQLSESKLRDLVRHVRKLGS